MNTALTVPDTHASRVALRPHHRYLPEARYVARQITLALRQREVEPVFARFILTETRQHTIWLFAVLDKTRITKMEPYLSKATLHQISTLVNGRPTLVSNTTGLRYAVLLSGKPCLPEMIAFPDELSSDRYPLGVTLRGPLQVSWERLRNVLLTGVQGSGKSAFLTGVANVALWQGHRLLLADPEEHTFNPERWNPLTGIPVAATDIGFRALLQRVQAEVHRRGALYREIAGGQRPPENLAAYNHLACQQGKPELPRLLLLADEANDFFDDAALTRKLAELARHARKWGLNLVLAAHNWRAADVPRKLSGRFPTRIAFRVSDDTSARVVLDDVQWGKRAMHLSGPGRGLIRLPGQSPQLFQAYYLSPDQEQRWQAQVATTRPDAWPEVIPPASLLTEQERRLAFRSLAEAGGKMSRDLLQAWGLGWRAAEELGKRWEARGWLSKDPARSNARYLTPALLELLEEKAASAGADVQAVPDTLNAGSLPEIGTTALPAQPRSTAQPPTEAKQ